MNTLLWALQIILTAKLLTVTFNHGLHPDPVKMQRGRERFGSAARPLLLIISLLALLFGLGSFSHSHRDSSPGPPRLQR